MTEEYIYERERDFLDYLRNNLEDPETRGYTKTDEFIATDGQTTFILSNNLVKNVADTISVNGLLYRKGVHYKVEYGEGKDISKVILNTPATLDDEINITYYYGSALVEREFSRTNTTLPRVVVMFLIGDEEFAGLGDLLEYGKGSYFNATFRIEIRDKYANRARIIASKCFNLVRKIRHANLFRTNIVSAGGMQNFDYDRDKECYIWMFNADIQWEIRFE